MRKLTNQERIALTLIQNFGRPFVPGVSTAMPKQTHKLLRGLVSRGDLTVEETDDGPAFSLTAQGRADAS